MAGPPVSIGALVVLTPGAAGPPDSGVILAVLPPFITAKGLPLATAGSLCQMVNSLTGVPYVVPIGPLASSGVAVAGRALVRLGDSIPTPPGVLTVLGPPAAPFITDTWAN
jgi:hypothetical protein